MKVVKEEGISWWEAIAVSEESEVSVLLCECVQTLDFLGHVVDRHPFLRRLMIRPPKLYVICSMRLGPRREYLR